MIALLVGLALAQDPSRFALVVGANNGGAERVRLKYAVTDAQTVADVLVELGNVPDDQLVRLHDPDSAGLQGALTDLSSRIEEWDGPASVLVYYSGHSDSQGLLLGRDTYAWGDLRAGLDGLGASLQVAIIDGCASGTLVRAKGGTEVPAFLEMATGQIEGRATLTSSSADEVSQEADHIGGSYFTHALVTGMRGAADFDADQRITLRESYTFAAEETLARTERTRLGAQHPHYEMELRGTGDFVLTDLRNPTTKLVLGLDLRGRVFLRDVDGRLVSEQMKHKGSAVMMVLPAGRYDAVVDDRGELFEVTVRVTEQRVATVRAADLLAVDGQVTMARGRIYARVPVAIEFVPYPTSDGLNARDQLHHISLGVVAVYAARLSGFALGTVATTYRDGADGVQLSAAYNHSNGPQRGVQMTFGVNVAGAQMRGFQLGTVNIAGRSQGFQLGVVNVAMRHQGFSLSVLHVSRTSTGWPLALFPIIGDGMHHFELSGGTFAPLSLGVKLGSRNTYTVWEAGFDPMQPSARFGVATGVRFRPGPVHLDLDVANTFAGLGGRSVYVPALRVSVARPFSVGSHTIAPFVRMSAGLALPLEDDSRHVGWVPWQRQDTDVAFAPELAAGIRL